MHSTKTSYNLEVIGGLDSTKVIGVIDSTVEKEMFLIMNNFTENAYPCLEFTRI